LQPYGLLRDILAWRLQIADGDSAEVARRRLVEGLAPISAENGELQAELLGQLVGLDFSASPRLGAVLKEPRQLRDRALAAFDRLPAGPVRFRSLVGGRHAARRPAMGPTPRRSTGWHG
jgi:hypothetical protein